jgi:hypothetical protein
LKKAPASLIHNANIQWLEETDIVDLIQNVGYRYQLKSISSSAKVVSGEDLYVKMVWINLGNSPNYPLMGQDFQLHVYLVNSSSGDLVDILIGEDISKWLPSTNPGAIPPPENIVESLIQLPEQTDPGRYDLLAAIVDQRTGLPIFLANTERQNDGYYLFSSLEVLPEK